jgi:hypothetical protein
MKGDASRGTETGAFQFQKDVSVDAPGSPGRARCGGRRAKAARRRLMQGFAKAARGAADEMEEQSPTVARYVRRAAASVEGDRPEECARGGAFPRRQRGRDEEGDDPLRRGPGPAALRQGDADPVKVARIGRHLDLDHTDFIVI